MNWAEVANHMTDRMSTWSASRDRSSKQVKFRAVAVLGLYKKNYVASDADWRELENELRAREYCLYRPDNATVVLVRTSHVANITSLSLGDSDTDQQ